MCPIVAKGKDLLTLRVRERLIALRNHAGMTDSSLSRAANLRQQDVSRFMLGEAKYPAMDFMDALCRVFNYTLAELLDKDIAPSQLTESERAIVAAMKAMTNGDRASFENLILRKPSGKTERRRG